MLEYLMVSIVVGVLGLAAVIGFLMAALPRMQRRRELARRQRELADREELEDFIRRVDQATTNEELDRLDNEKEER